jgi:hypothetical protein
MPSWQTLPVPHDVPFGLLSLSVQTGAPVVHAMVPVRQGLLATSHVAPAIQAWQLPSKHTPLSQVVPFVCERPVSRQIVPPPSAHTVSPWWQALAGTQAAPGTQLTVPSRRASGKVAGASGVVPSGVVPETSIPRPSRAASERLVSAPASDPASLTTSPTEASNELPGPPSTSVGGRSGSVQPESAKDNTTP